MTVIRILIACLFAHNALGDNRSLVAPASSIIAKTLEIPEANAKNAPANIDLILRKDRGIMWRHYYRISAEPAGTFMIAVLEHKYVPKPEELGAGKHDASPPHRNFTESNGDVCHVTSKRIIEDRTEVIARLVRIAGDWDILIQYITDAATIPEHADRLSDERMRSYIGNLSTELKKTEQAAPSNR